MVRTLSAGLETEMSNLNRDVAGALTVEPWLPSWTARISGLSGGETEQYAHGHAAAVYPDGVSAGEDILFRARSGSYASPQDGKLYFAVISGSDLDSPAGWDSLWTDSGRTGLMYPAWTANSGASYGGSVAVAVWDNSGTPTGRIFYTKATGYLYHQDVNLSTGALSGSEVSIANLGTGYQLASMQVASCGRNEVFVLVTSQVEASQAAWQKALYGTTIRRYVYTASWALDSNAFPFHTCLEGSACKDNIDYDASTSDTVAQWGKRPCGGLGALEIDTNTALVAFGAVHWRRRGYWTHNAGLRTFIYHRDSGFWEEGPESDGVDFTDGQRLKLAMFAKANTSSGSNMLVWSRLVEPSDFEQADATPTISRVREVVWAKLSADGKHLTHFERLGDQDELTGAALVEINRNGAQQLFAIGWRSVYESAMAAAVGTVDTPTDLGDYATGWAVKYDNRLGMRVDAKLHDPSLIYDGDLARGMLVRAELGTSSETTQVAQGFVDQLLPTLSGGGRLQAGASLNARADQLLQETVSETMGDMLSQGTVQINPDGKIKHIRPIGGVWDIAQLRWPGKFFSGEFAALTNDLGYRLKSFPFAKTGADLLKNLEGSWFNDIAMVGLTPRVEGGIEASLRFGDDVNLGNFNVTIGGTTYTATINRTNGYITSITWGFPTPNSPAQYAIMGGLICHAPEVKRKYMFIWECNSDISTSSHANDTYVSETFDKVDYSAYSVGANRLYLVMTDYSGANFVNKAVAYTAATGLTAGKPADLRMQVVGGTIYCFYRYHSTGTPNQWRFAFSYKTGRFGASSFGIIGRGQAGITWKALSSVEAKIAQTVNMVDFWNIKASDGVMDRTMEEHLARHCWSGWTPTEFETTESEATHSITSGSSYKYAATAVNPTIDFKLSLPSATNEGGVFLRGVDSGTPTNTCIKIGLVVSSTAHSATTAVPFYVVKRRYASGSEVTSAREYSPFPLQLRPGYPIPVRVAARGSIYSVWVAGVYAGHFRDETSLGNYFGLYATGGTGSFTEIVVPELYEVPIFAPLKPNQSMAGAVRGVLNGRRIKGIFQADGAVKFSYFDSHDSGPDLEDTLVRSDYRVSDRFVSVVRVEGAYTFAEYQSTAMLAKGRRFQYIHNPDIYHYEFAYQEARAILTELAERNLEMSLTGLPDLRIEGEDQIGITVTEQGITGDFLVDDVGIAFEPGAGRADMSLGVRSVVVL